MRSEGLELRRRGIRRVVVGVSKVCTGLSHILRWKGGGEGERRLWTGSGHHRSHGPRCLMASFSVPGRASRCTGRACSWQVTFVLSRPAPSLSPQPVVAWPSPSPPNPWWPGGGPEWRGERAQAPWCPCLVGGR